MKKKYLLLILFAVSIFRAQAQPPVSATTPPARSASDVVSIFSDAYTNVAGTDFFPNWGQTTVVTDVSIAGNTTKKYATFNYQGIQFASSVDASAMTSLHIDVWTPDCTTFDVYLINTSPSTVEQKVSLTPTLSGWNSYDIALSKYNTIALNNIGQFKLVGTPSSTTVYLDNIYFWKSSNTPTITGFTVPAKKVGDLPFTLTDPTSNSTGAFSYTSSNTSVATISGKTVTIVGGGTSIITATQAAAGSYVTGNVSATLVVTFATPSTAAPIPPVRKTTDVVSLFSDAYTNVAGTDFFPNWGQSTVVSDVSIAGNATKKYDYMNYQGIQFASNVDASGMTNLHLDLWTPNCTAFDVFLINTGANTVEQNITLTPTLSGWNSFDILLSKYNTIDLSKIGQIKLVALPSSTTTVYLDNLYFWKGSAVVATGAPTTAAPVPPVRNSNDVVSVFSNAYTNVSGTDFFPNWGQSTVVSDTVIAGDTTKKYAILNYQGIQFASAVSASSMTSLHIDVWTPDCTSLIIKLINTSPSTVEQGDTLTPTLSGWNSFDIPLSMFNKIALSNIGQMSLTGTPGSTVYMDNLYFWKSGSTPTITGFTVPAKLVGDAPFTLTDPTSNSTGAFTYTSGDTKVATISGKTVTIVGAGTSIITATQAAAGNYGSGTTSATLVVTYPTPTVAAPVPTVAAANVISLFSDAYTNVAAIDWFPNWGQSTVVSDITIAGNTTKKYYNLNYQGVQFASALDVSKAKTLHLDVWTPDCTSLIIKLINTSPSTVEQGDTLTPTLSGWNSFDIPLSMFSKIALNNVGQMSFTGNAGSTVYVDNVYFWSTITLPVHIAGFKAVKQGTVAAISWKTLSENNNKGFDVERSINGNNWAAIQFVGAKGVANQYAVTDNAPLNGINYYRLKQIDIDGKSTYSTTVAVDFSANALGFSFYPNPVKNRLTVSLQTINSKQASIDLVSINGKKVKSINISNTDSNSNIAIDCSNVATGTYFLVLRDGSTVKTTKVVVE
ncbi:T9SS type A sorting domain-containing protein [Parasediminibacterium sp. JCM 36343]|uniref:T9SS type A sorting domain-containing protein n=1 Tax=Parasediminibacterium sp. JCM 36343 TaxID=3374279 RepID=UPI0039782BAE